MDCSSWRVVADEFGGAYEKSWLSPPGSDERWLFKPVTEKPGHLHGEDWAEKAASELAALLGVPCARIDMSIRNGRRGALSRNLRPSNYDMHSGAVLLSDFLPGYVPGATNPRGRPGHSLANIKAALDAAGPPPEFADFLPNVPMSGYDVFAGVLLLDAWIANQDRHDENWSILVPHDPQLPRRLCGSYDQAGCLGFNLLDAKKARMLHEGRVPQWAARGTAGRFEHTDKPQSLVSLAAEGLALASAEARSHWLSAIAGVSDEAVLGILARLPVLSDVGRTFAGEVLMTNRKRLLDECH